MNEEYKEQDESATVQEESNCHDCGAVLHFEPGTSHLKCKYCGAENDIEAKKEFILHEEIDFHQFLAETNIADDQKEEVHTVKCTSCGASSTLKPNISADSCAFCDTPLVISTASSSKIVKPKYLLPFKIKDKEALTAFQSWVKGLWFAPNDLKLKANNPDKLNGMYMPYWTYDTNTNSTYQGMRGIHRMESYSITVNGKTETRTRTVTDWYPCSGYVYLPFDDVLVLASNSLPEKYTNELEPWDLQELTEYNSKFLSGFRSEIYQVDLVSGFEKLKGRVEPEIRNAIHRDIGGNEQRIISMQTQYDNVTFKHILLPIWISSFKYNEKVYRFMINGRTGEVQGERPYSWIKIAATIVLGLAVVGTIIYFISQNK